MTASRICCRPVVTDPKKAVVALKWVVAEMEERYRKMSKMGVRNIDGYNARVEDAQARGEMFSRTVQTGFDDDTGEPVFETEEFAPEKMPYIVVIVDEMADLMMVAGKEIEACIQRLAQMARASGIHMIMATQRPSVDVITGTIKANFPTRISFQVTSKVDSRTILGEMGAEQLLGMGDMLYMAGGGKITRCHGPFVSDEEVEEVVNHLKAYGPPEYVGGVQEGPRTTRPAASTRCSASRPAATPTARTRSTIRRCKSPSPTASAPPPTSSASWPSATTRPRGWSSRWRSRASSAPPTMSASARCWCPSSRAACRLTPAGELSKSRVHFPARAYIERAMKMMRTLILSAARRGRRAGGGREAVAGRDLRLPQRFDDRARRVHPDQRRRHASAPAGSTSSARGGCGSNTTRPRMCWSSPTAPAWA